MKLRFGKALLNGRYMKLRNLFLLLVLPTAFLSFKTYQERIMKKSFFNNELNGTPYITIDKSEYELNVYDDDGWFATYPVVFGSKNLTDKMMEGDRKTPEGNYKIVSKRPHDKWGQIMLIDYPTKTDIQKFNERKTRGVVPKWAKIGGGIGIHGTWPRDEMVVDYYQNWTNGCVALKREEMREIYNMIPLGTKVTIQP